MLSVKNFMIQTVIFKSSRSCLQQVKAVNAAKLRLDQCYMNPKSNHRKDPNQIITFMTRASAMILQHCNDEPLMLYRTTFNSIKNAYCNYFNIIANYLNTITNFLYRITSINI